MMAWQSELIWKFGKPGNDKILKCGSLGVLKRFGRNDKRPDKKYKYKKIRKNYY